MASSMSYVVLWTLLMASAPAVMSDVQAPVSSPGDDHVYADTTGSIGNFAPKYFKILDGSHFEKLQSSPSVGVVYFYKRNPSHQISKFLQEYDKSAGFLNAYGLTLGLVDCTPLALAEPLQKACSEADEKKIYTYRNGESILVLDLETMFDVNSIMSNILQLVMLDEVTIIQTKLNRQKLEHENAGQTDIIYSYHNAIGTHEHRVFMEIAYAYQDKYKFVVSTEPRSIDGLQDAESVTEGSVCAMWVLYCREKYSAATGCHSVNYLGDFSLVALATFFKQLSWPLVVYQSEDALETHPCQTSDEATCIYISHSSSTKEQVDAVLDVIKFDLHGMAGLIIQQIDEEGARGTQDPQLSIKKEMGDFVVMEKDWSLDEVQYFLSAQMFPISDDREADAMPFYGEEPEADKIDDMVLQVAARQQKIVKNDIPVLTDKTFPTTVKDRKLVVVLFYIPFDALGMLFLSPYQEAGKELAALKGDDPSDHPLVRIDCYDWTDVCQKENITSYPVIHIYRNGGDRQQYRQALDKDVLVRTVWLLQAEQPLLLKTAEEVESFVAGHLPAGAHKLVDNFVLLRPSKSQKEVKPFKSSVRALETQMLFAIVRRSIQTNIVPEGGILHVRLSDKHQALETLTENLEGDSIYKFLLKGQFHLLPELTHLNFPTLYARKQPFGILFFDPADDPTLEPAVVNIIKSNKIPDLIFCKMNMHEINPVADAVLTNYTQSVILPTFAVVNHQKGEVFVLQGMEVEEENLLSWLQTVQDGVQPPTKILEKGEWKPPGRHYDYLAMMDSEKRKQKKRADDAFSPYCESGDCEGYGDGDAPHLQSTGEIEAEDSDIRSNLLELQRSRLYSGKDRKLPLHTPDDEEGDGNSLLHDEF